MENKKYVQITDDELKTIMEDIIKKCDTDPKDVANFISRVGDTIGILYEIDYYTKELKPLKEKFENDLKKFTQKYNKTHKNILSKEEIKEKFYHYIQHVMNKDPYGYYFYLNDIIYNEDKLHFYLHVDNAFCDCKSMEYIDGKWTKIFTPQQIKSLYQSIEKYVFENKKTNVIFAVINLSVFCKNAFEEKYLPSLYDLCLKSCNLNELINTSYNLIKYHKTNINFENVVKEKVIKEGNCTDLVNYLSCFSHAYYENEKDKKANKTNNDQIAELILKTIISSGDKYVCENLLSIAMGCENNVYSNKFTEYFDKKVLMQTYLSICSKKEVKDFVDKIKNRIEEAERTELRKYDDYEYFEREN